MKVLITGLNFAPELTGVGKYMGEMADWLVAAGAEVRVVVAPPYYPGWRVAEGYSGWRYRVERHGALTVVRCPLYVPGRPGGIGRLLHLLSFAISSAPVLLWHGLSWRPDVVFVAEPPLAVAPAALCAARLGGAAAWLHIQDFEVDAAFALEVLSSTRLRRALAALERLLMRRFDRVSTISGRMMERLLQKGVPAARTRLFPNWTDFRRIAPLYGVSPMRARLGIGENAVVLLYSGTFGAKQGLELLLEVIRALPTDCGVELVLCGDGPSRGRLAAAAAGLPRVHFLPLQPVDRLNELMALADIHALPQRKHAEDLVMPSKLTTMLASGRVVVACASPGSEVGRVVEGVGRVVPPGDPAEFAAAVLELARDRALRTRLGLAGRIRAQSIWDAEGVLGSAFGAASLAELGVKTLPEWPSTDRAPTESIA